MTLRMKRNYVPVLNREHKKLLMEINHKVCLLRYSLTPKDLSGTSCQTKYNRLHKLEAMDYIEIVRDERGKIRAIVPLARP